MKLGTTKKIPQRQCIGCNEMKNKKDLIRILKQQDEVITIDTTGKKNGRGAYICASDDCLNKAIKTKRLAKMFEIDINQKIYEDLRDVIANIPKEN